MTAELARSSGSVLGRREALCRLAGGLGALALATLLRRDGLAATSAPVAMQVAPRAKRVIYIFLSGGASQLDLFDEKPVLRKRDGELCPAELFEGKQLAFIRTRPNLLGSPYEFARDAKSGMSFSNLVPELRSISGEIALVRSMQTDQFNHAPAQLLALTGFPRGARPSFGAWMSYALGSENDDLPSFVVLTSGGTYPGAGTPLWGPGFLPSVHQGVELRSQGDPVLFLSDPPGIDRADRRRMLDAVNDLNAQQLAATADPEIETRISQYEMAYRMQASVPEAMDIAREPRAMHEMYGTEPGKPRFANNCLLARRLIERGVRFVQMFDDGWDMHTGVFQQLPEKCASIDRPIAALIRDLKQRGLLDDTLVVFGTEFGRTPLAQTVNNTGQKGAVGRDHHRDAFTVFLAGAGVKKGFEYGRTDDFGYSVVESPVHVHDLNATLLHLLGYDHEKLTVRYKGRDFRLTDVHGHVVPALLA